MMKERSAVQGRRVERVAALIREELGKLLLSRAKDPILREATITEVTVSPDLAVARVFFTGAEGKTRRIKAALEGATPFLRRQLATQLRLKRTPELRFQQDEALEHGMRVDAILREIAEPEAGDEP